jgi:hypothetical protein
MATVEVSALYDAFFFAAAFFLAAHRFFIAMESAFRPASVRPPFLTEAGALAAGVALGVASAGAGASAAAFAALMSAHRFFVAAMIARFPAALSFRLAGFVGLAVAGSFESCSTDGGAAFRPGPGCFSVVVEP